MNYYAKNYQQADATFAALAIKYPEEPSCIFGERELLQQIKMQRIKQEQLLIYLSNG